MGELLHLEVGHTEHGGACARPRLGGRGPLVKLGEEGRLYPLDTHLEAGFHFAELFCTAGFHFAKLPCNPGLHFAKLLCDPGLHFAKLLCNPASVLVCKTHSVFGSPPV